MTRELRSTITLLSVSAVAGILAAACSGGDDQGQTTNVQTGGATYVTPHTGGKPAATGGAAATGGRSSTGGATAATGGSPATGGAAPTGGNASVGGSSATGGSTASTGGAGTSATGGSTGTAVAGSSAVGGATSVGGTSTAGGSSAVGGKTGTGGSGTPGGATATGGSGTVGGATATGGGSALAACSVDNNTSDPNFSTTTAFCRPANADLTLISGQMSVSTLNINAANGQIAMTGTIPFVGNLTLTRPFNQAPCASSGLDAEVANSNPAVAYTGLTLQVTNGLNSPTTLVLYLADRITSGGSSYYAIATAPIDVGANATVTKTLRWSDLALSCTAPAAFDSKQILAIGFGFNQTGTVNLTITNVTFSTT